MGKIRVYELAKELNMKIKALLDKMEEMNITVSSHMSSIDDKIVAKIRANIFGKKTDGMEPGMKTTVIRRARKEMEVAALRPMMESHRGSGDDVADTELPGFIPAAKSSGSVSGESSETRKIDTDDERISVQTPVQSSDDHWVAEKISDDLSMKKTVVSTTERQEAAAKVLPQSSQKAPDLPPATEHPVQSLGQVEQAMDSASTVRELRTSRNDSVSKVPVREKPEESGKAPSMDAEKNLKKKKKGKKDTPAKIIKLAPKLEEQKTPDVVLNELPPPVIELPVEDGIIPVDQPDEKMIETIAQETLEGEKKKKKKSKEEESEARWVKKKISFTRKEVVEGDELYARTGQGKKKKRGGKLKAAPPQKPQITVPKAIKRRIKIDETIVLSDLAKRMGIKANEMIKKLMMMGVMATVNQTIDYDVASVVAAEFGYEVEKAAFEEKAVMNLPMTDHPDSLLARPPVVTIMGHVDHGKTSLLDVIRKTRVTEIEAGGITQHIGAYSVSTPGGQITFLDTPGHEAFTAMRARGATVTDIVILVVAADDGVMPQTIEAVNHSKAAGVPIIVAVNKMDKPGADPDRVMRELSDQGLQPEEWGGETIFVRVSAKKNQGIEELLEMILLQSEVLELKANPNKLAKGYVVESKLDSGRGPVATILIQEGTLKNGDAVVCGVHHGKVRAMLNDLGEIVDRASPACPVEVLGLSGVPNAGDELIALEDEKSAKQVSEHRLQKQRSKELAQTSRMSLDKLFERMKQEEVKDLNIILKADVHGSIEALSESLVKLSNEEVTIRIVHSATGTVSESDVSLAAVSDAIIIGFNVRPTSKVQNMANEEHVDMRFYNIIYNVIKDVKDAILGLMESKFEERTLGIAEIRDVFHVPKVGAIAGCYVTDGKIQRGRQIRLVRDGVVIHEGKIGSLRRFKDDVKEVVSGYECGIGIDGYNDIKIGDVIECFYFEEVKPAL